MNKKIKDLTFEVSLKKLEDITQQMEVRISEWNEENPWPFSQ